MVRPVVVSLMSRPFDAFPGKHSVAEISVIAVNHLEPPTLSIAARQSRRLKTREAARRYTMGSVNWKWLAVGAALGYFAVPYAMNFVKNR